ncbi:MAG: hypothetical protein R2880_06720 [Deinococcales bacterium]
MIAHISVKVSLIGLIISGFFAFCNRYQVSQQETNLVGSITPRVEVLSSPRSDITASIVENHGTSEGQLLLTLKATGYNSMVGQTDSTPYTTATGSKTRFGIIAVSRDLLGKELPYGSMVRLHDLGHYKTGADAGSFQDLFDAEDIFIVEDTMHPRKRQQIDIWFPRYSQAAQWGIRQVELEIVRYGREGPLLLAADDKPKLNLSPQLAGQ